MGRSLESESRRVPLVAASEAQFSRICQWHRDGSRNAVGIRHFWMLLFFFCRGQMTVGRSTFFCLLTKRGLKAAVWVEASFCGGGRGSAAETLIGRFDSGGNKPAVPLWVSL